MMISLMGLGVSAFLNAPRPLSWAPSPRSRAAMVTPDAEAAAKEAWLSRVGAPEAEEETKRADAVRKSEEVTKARWLSQVNAPAWGETAIAMAKVAREATEYAALTEACKADDAEACRILSLEEGAKREWLEGLDAPAWGAAAAAVAAVTEEKDAFGMLDAKRWAEAAAAMTQVAEQAAELAALLEQCDAGDAAACDTLSREEEARRSWFEKQEPPPPSEAKVASTTAGRLARAAGRAEAMAVPQASPPPAATVASAPVVPCTYCGGTGRIPCGRCFGHKLLEFRDEAAGLRVEECAACQSTGSVVCINCQGSGTQVPEEFYGEALDQIPATPFSAPAPTMAPAPAPIFPAMQGLPLRGVPAAAGVSLIVAGALTAALLPSGCASPAAPLRRLTLSSLDALALVVGSRRHSRTSRRSSPCAAGPWRTEWSQRRWWRQWRGRRQRRPVRPRRWRRQRRRWRRMRRRGRRRQRRRWRRWRQATWPGRQGRLTLWERRGPRRRRQRQGRRPTICSGCS